MDKLSAGATVSGRQIFTTLNHDQRGNPHDQYLGKSTQANTLNSGADINKMALVSRIRWLRDTNYTLNYQYVLGNSRDAELSRLKIKLNYNGVESFDADFSGHFQIVGVYKDLGLNTDLSDGAHSVGELSIYIRLQKTYLTVNCQLFSASVQKPVVGTTVFQLKNDYAFKTVEMFSEQALSDNLTGNIDTVYHYQTVFGSNTWQAVQVPASQGIFITLDNTSLLWDSIVSVSLSAKLPQGLVMSPPTTDATQKKITINVFNASTITQTFPACTISYSIENKSRK